MGGTHGRVDRGPASGLCGPGAGVRRAGVGEAAGITVKQRERLKDAGLRPRVTRCCFEVSLRPADRHIDGNGQVREGPYQPAHGIPLREVITAFLRVGDSALEIRYGRCGIAEVHALPSYLDPRLGQAFQVTFGAEYRRSGLAFPKSLRAGSAERAVDFC